MIAVGQTLESLRYPTEVTYYPTGAETPSVYPNPGATSPPYDNSTPVSLAYGGWGSIQDHFAEGGLVANPRALTRFFHVIDAIYLGKDTHGPLSQATVTEMLSFSDGSPISGKSWFGLGWQVYALSSTEPTTPGTWAKNGAIPGTAAELVQIAAGPTFAYTLNEDVSDSLIFALNTDLFDAIKAWNGA
jgi:hypothetical protein